MSAHVLLHIVHKFGEKVRCKAVPRSLSFSLEFNKFCQMSELYMSMNARFYLLYDSEIAFNLQSLPQNAIFCH